MTCVEFRERLEAATVSDESDAALSQLREHRRDCPDPVCRALWSEARLLERAIPLWRATLPTASGSLSRRVLAALDLDAAVVAGPAAPARPARRWTAAALVAAALSLLLASAVLGPESSMSPTIARRDPWGRDHWRRELKVAPALAAGEGSPPIEIAYVAYAREATHFVTDLAMLIVPVPVAADDEEAAGPPWLERLGDRIEPVRQGVTTKLDEWFGGPAT